jgi:hypothetical protein
MGFGAVRGIAVLADTCYGGEAIAGLHLMDQSKFVCVYQPAP